MSCLPYRKRRGKREEAERKGGGGEEEGEGESYMKVYESTMKGRIIARKWEHTRDSLLASEKAPCGFSLQIDIINYFDVRRGGGGREERGGKGKGESKERKK